jgi:hypothetical protein
VCYTALGLSILSFVVFLVSAIHKAWIANKAAKTSSSAADIANRTVQAQAAGAVPAPTIPDLTNLIIALTGVINALKSAGAEL